jgi:hypothetical protein
VTRHIDLLGVLLLAWSALGLLAGCSCLLLAVGAASILGSRATEDSALVAAPVAVMLLFAAVGLSVIFLSGVHAGAGFGLRRRRSWSRPLALALGVVDLLLLPFGTALGLYTLWVLLHTEARRIFHRVPA